MKKLLLILAILALSSLLLVACGGEEPATPVVEEPVVEEPVQAEEPVEVEEPMEEGLPDLGGQEVTIAVENAYLPFNYLDPDTGEPAGWDYDVWDEICALLNCVPVYTESAWEGMIQSVADGQFDAAADGITITDERDEIVDFSMGYISIEQRLLVRADDDRISGIEDIVNDENLNLGTQTGTTNYATAATYLPEDRIQAFEQFPFAVQALIAGDIDAVIIDEVAGQGYLGENADLLALVGESMSSDQLGFIFPNGSDLVAAVDMALEEMMKNGFLETVNAQYFGPDFNVTYDDLFPPEIGSEDQPIKVMFVPSVDAGVIVSGGELMAQALNEATGLYFEVVVPTSYAATIEEMCASPSDTMGFIPPLGYALASQLCGVDVAFKAVRYDFPIYWAQILVARDSDIQTVEDLNGKTWGYTDAGSTSGYLLPLAFFADKGITPGEATATGGHNQAVKAVYNGEVDFATTFYSVPFDDAATYHSAWSYDDYLAGTVTEDMYDIPDDVIPSCAVSTEDERLYCGDWRPMDARPNIRAEAPDVIQKVRILALTVDVPNDAMAFGPDFPDDLRAQIVDALYAFSETDAWDESIGNPDFYAWSGIIPATDAEYDFVRLMIESAGLTLEGLGE
ncbi:MAG: phosphate/phosphite/phosphonate ABC transporter substrate-binding protein [Anaerolineales bacterium]|nr:phosphate/phosphite/phosphonate ABC transporter substrate-binding protein [Anaerolineales bacterium]